MTNHLLNSLREHILDESEPLAGLLRKCLMLGAETGSETLRQWARRELNGYDDDVELPNYRLLRDLPIKVDSISGNTWAQGMTYNRLQLPAEAQKGVPDTFPLRQAVEELENLAQSKTLSFTSTGLAYAQTVWNSQLDSFQQITGMRYSIPGSVVTGILGQIRTQLVDVIADLTAKNPLAELPKKDAVDTAVSQHIETQYNTTIQESNGPTAIGHKAKSNTEGVGVRDALRLLDAAKVAAMEVADNQDRSELLEAIEDLRTAAEQSNTDAGDAMVKAGKLQTIAEKLGIPTVTAAVGGVVGTVTNLALSGALG
ncbi:AbiTii domain-containing protein [Arthrobacter rhombi]|uniref:AbiTii domain-containing protein n=1 Tax=Arthrobacter rhombi TaxID=71253 RepID=UPI003FD6AD43